MWSKWKFGVAALLSMLTGASVVHNLYRPNLEIPERPPDLAEVAAPATFVGWKVDEDKK